MSQQSNPLDISNQAEPVDKISILQAISIFANTPRAILDEVADMLEQVEYRAGDLIFAKGDLGTSMYVVVTGSVWVHDGDMGIATLYACFEALGGLAAVQGAPIRSLRLVDAATRLREAIGAPLPPAETSRLREKLAPARQQLSQEDQDAAEAAGRALTFEQAIELATHWTES
jgi:hypothetical protein